MTSNSTNSDSTACAIFGLEVFVDLVNVPLSILTFYLIYTTMVIHRNLKFILLCQTVDFLLRSVIKLLFTLPGRVFNGNIFWFERAIPPLQFVFFSTIIFRMLIGHVIVVERLLATVFASNYETYSKNTFSALWFIIVMLIVLIDSTSQFFALSVDNDAIATTLTVTTTVGVTMLSFLEIGISALLWHYNKRKFDNYHRRVSLAERYQLRENARTNLQLVPALFLYFLLLFNSSFIQILFNVKFIVSQYGQNISLIIVNFITSLLQMLIQIAILIFHPVLKQRLRFICQQLFWHNQVGPEEASIGLELEDKQLNTEKHFELLSHFWKQER